MIQAAMKRAAPLVVAIMATTGALAAPVDKNATWGVGNESCHHALSDVGVRVQIRPWIEGYLSATKTRVRRYDHAHAGEGLTAELEEYCRRHPVLTVGNALRTLVMPFGG